MIPRIEIRSIGIRPINTQAIHIAKINFPDLQISVPLGFPIIEMPCVRARRNIENDALIDTDPEQNLVLCSGSGAPAYDPINYEPLRIVPIKEEEQQRHEEPEILPADSIPEAMPEVCPPDGSTMPRSSLT